MSLSDVDVGVLTRLAAALDADTLGLLHRLTGSGASGQAIAAPHPPTFDQERLGKQTYLTIPEVCVYGRFPSEQAVYSFLARNTHRIPKCRQGRKVLILAKLRAQGMTPEEAQEFTRPAMWQAPVLPSQ